MYRFLLTTVFALVTVCSQAMAHPCDEFNANESLIYENLLGESAWQAGEIKFYSLSDRTPYSQLSNTERYMVAGGVDTETGLNYAPWYDQVMDVVKMYFDRNEAVPAELSHELVDALDDDRELEEDSLAFRILHNPVQDRPVRLDAVDF